MSAATIVPEETLPSGGQLRKRHQLLTSFTSLISLTLISGYLVALLSLTEGQWRSFFSAIGVLVPIILAVQWLVIDRPIWAPIRAYLDASEQDDPEPLRAEAFRAVLYLPQYTGTWGLFWYAFGGSLLTGWLLVMAGITGYAAAIILAAAGTGGFVGVLFQYFASKALLAPTRERLARELPDLAEREGLVRKLSLRKKVIGAVTGVTLVVVLFAIFLAQVRASRSIELATLRLQTILLARAAEDFEDSLSEIEITEEMHALDIEFLLFDPETGGVLEGPPGVLSAFEVEAVRQGLDIEPFGDSRAFDSRNAFAWQSLRDGRVLVAYTPWSRLSDDSAELWVIFGLLLGTSTLLALGLGLALSREICSGIEAVRSEAMRLGGGDLSPGRVYESEDEIGDLARGFQQMAGFLRATVGSVVEAADRVENAAAEFASVGDAVAEATGAQRKSVAQAGESMLRIRGEVQGIAASSQDLNTFMEESSSSVAELGAVGEELSQNAQVLSAKVDESSSSVEEMIRSVSEVSRNAEGLHEAASETSSSMEEMAASMREVETNASETARLSSDVARMADEGRDKVRQTIDGMYAIREATDTAQHVIKSLGERAKEIGAVVEVIDDVADETNLLALNAAIIAAQAGDHGRSFSVVADEIKELADRVLASTKEIGGQIRAVQEESANAVGAIESGSESVQSGVDLSAEAGVALEQITDAARDAGDRIVEIVTAVQEQSKASAHVVALMDRVGSGVDQIRVAGQEQDRSNQVVLEGCTTMRDVAAQVRLTTDEQSRGSNRIGESVESVREAVEKINASLQEQSAACGQAAEFLNEVNDNTATNQQSTERMREAMRGLVQQAESLRKSVQRFRL